MALPPLPPSNTVRLFLDYTSQEILHTVQFRVDGLPTDTGSFLSGIIDNMQPLMRIDDQITQVRFSQVGSDVTIPLFQVNQNGTASNASSIADDPESVFVSCPFRGLPSGRKGRYEFFFPTNQIPLDENNRFPFGTVTNLINLENALINLADTGSAGVHLCDISGSRIIFNSYWNRAKSAYWTRRQRLGT